MLCEVSIATQVSTITSHNSSCWGVSVQRIYVADFQKFSNDRVDGFRRNGHHALAPMIRRNTMVTVPKVMRSELEAHIDVRRIADALNDPGPWLGKDHVRKTCTVWPNNQPSRVEDGHRLVERGCRIVREESEIEVVFVRDRSQDVLDRFLLQEPS